MSLILQANSIEGNKENNNRDWNVSVLLNSIRVLIYNFKKKIVSKNTAIELDEKIWLTPSNKRNPKVWN